MLLKQTTAQSLLKEVKRDITSADFYLRHAKTTANQLWIECDKSKPDEDKFEELNFYRGRVREIKDYIRKKAELSVMLKTIVRKNYGTKLVK